MYTSLEIEFKCKIDEDTYKLLLEEFNLTNEVKTQINYYFDTPDYSLRKDRVTLRIREKDYNIKLTSKTHVAEGILERHIVLDKNESYQMIEEGFNASIIGIDLNVFNVAKLTTHRAKTKYFDSILFFDKNEYYGEIDYEIEFEVTDEEKGFQIFLNFLNEHNIPFVKTESKIARAYKKSQQ